MKIWQKEWVKRALVVALLIVANIFGAIFFGTLGTLPVLFLTGFLSTSLFNNSKGKYRRKIMPFLISCFGTFIVYYFIIPIKFEYIIGDRAILLVCCSIMLSFLIGALLGKVSPPPTCCKEL